MSTNGYCKNIRPPRTDAPLRLSRRDFLLLSGGTALALGIASGCRHGWAVSARKRPA